MTCHTTGWGYLSQVNTPLREFEGEPLVKSSDLRTPGAPIGLGALNLTLGGDLRLAGQRTIPDRRVSLVDPDARPIRMGNPRRPTEFGYKARVADTAEGFVIVDLPVRGNPPDDGLLEGAVAKARRAGMQVRIVYADRGFGTRIADSALREHGVRDVVIPRRGRVSPVEQTHNWRRRYRFRNGLEGRISQLKRKGLRRTRLRGHAGAQTWTGGLALTHNLQRMALHS